MKTAVRSVATSRPTLEDIRKWPAAVSVEDSAAALGVSRAHAYDCIRLGTYPVRTIRVGSRIAVLTASILEALGAAGDAAIPGAA